MNGSSGGRSRAPSAPAMWAPLLVLLLVMTSAVLIGCGSSSTGSSDSADGGSGSSEQDSMLASWPKAQEAAAEVDPDVILLSAGTGGLALADVPENWDFVFYSAAKKRLYKVSVEHGNATPASDMGVTKNVKVTPAVDVAAVKVGGADVVVKARGFGEKSGTVPKNVLVVGSFASVPGAEKLGLESGVWYITFASGTDLADAVKYEVDMMTGKVAKAK